MSRLASLSRERAQRCCALLGVLVVHAAVIALLSRASSIREPGVYTPLLMTVPRKSKREPVIPRFHVDLQAISVSAVQPPTHPLSSEGARATLLPQVDWEAEAHRQAKQAADALNAPKVRSFDEHKPLDSLKDDSPAPEHYAGEQYYSGDGKIVVWVSPSCYQTSDVVRLPGIAGQGGGVQTYCKPKAHRSNGELFKDLDTYQRYKPR